MADICEEFFSEGFNSILSDNFSIYSKSISSDEDAKNEEVSVFFFLVRRRKLRSVKSNLFSK